MPSNAISYNGDGRLCLPNSFEKEAEEFGHEVHQWPAILYGKSVGAVRGISLVYCKSVNKRVIATEVSERMRFGYKMWLARPGWG